MSYVQRRRFLWILFLCALALLAVAASATTLSRLKLEDLALESTAVARMRCLGATSRWDKGEIWTETRFEVLEREKGTLPGIVTVRMLGGHVGNLHSHVDEVPAFRAGEEVYLFLWARKANRIRCWAGRKEHFALPAIRNPAWRWSPRIPLPRRFSIHSYALSIAEEFATYP